MRHKTLILTKLEKLDNELTNLNSFLSIAKNINEVKDKVFNIKEKVVEIRTLINTEGDDWK